MKRRINVKISTSILIILSVLLIGGVFASNIALKQVYDKRDNGDLYWNYNKILEQPFKYLKIDGGNVTKIIFEQNKYSSIRVLNSWHDDVKNRKLRFYIKRHLTPRI